MCKENKFIEKDGLKYLTLETAMKKIKSIYHVIMYADGFYDEELTEDDERVISFLPCNIRDDFSSVMERVYNFNAEIDRVKLYDDMHDLAHKYCGISINSEGIYFKWPERKGVDIVDIEFKPFNGFKWFNQFRSDTVQGVSTYKKYDDIDEELPFK